MLVKSGGGTAIVACGTCRLSAENSADTHGQSGGGVLISALRAARLTDPRYRAIAVQDMPCLFACKDFCTVHLRAPGKISYVLGRFVPGAQAARAILDYAVHYDASDCGIVPFAQWPEGVKGHFITRSPPEGYVAQ